MFVVCPVITDSEALESFSRRGLRAARAKEFKHRRVGLLHGQQNS